MVIKDQSATAELAVWQDLVDKLDVGSTVCVSDVRVKLFHGDDEDDKSGHKKLSTTPGTHVEVIEYFYINEG